MTKPKYDDCAFCGKTGWTACSMCPENNAPIAVVTWLTNSGEGEARFDSLDKASGFLKDLHDLDYTATLQTA